MLFLKDLFDVADLLLNFPRDLFVLAFCFEVRVVGGATHLFLDGALSVVDCAFYLVFCAVFHLSVPFSSV